LMLDLADARIVRAILGGLALDAAALEGVVAALAAKDRAALVGLTKSFPAESREALLALTELYGDASVLAIARQRLPRRVAIGAALDDLAWLAERVAAAHPEVKIGFDLADMGGYAYYSGARFAVYVAGAPEAVLRGGRYDEVGAVFGRNRPAVGFSTDLKVLVDCVAGQPRGSAIRAPWREDEALRQSVRRLRAQGETVVFALPGHEHEAEEFDCDRELVAVDGQWVLKAR
ncbi:MAG: ATP phosphoribosyltransferase regulatory subunit, partial [Burkholderiales bacterium]|nr:ATP phosphoribosyltransferase regulatory subunit [Burkholderiales bacterium]